MKLQLYMLCCLVFTTQCVRAQDSLVFIRLDQEGFYPKAPKIAVLAGILNKSSSTWSEKVLFFVIRENSADTVFRGKLSSVRSSFLFQIIGKQDRSFPLRVDGTTRGIIINI